MLWLIACNFATSLAWANVLFTLITHASQLLVVEDESDEECNGTLGFATNVALVVSFLEVFNCLTGFTRSPLPAVLLFSCTRMGVEKLVAPMIPCQSWQHLLTVACWSMGDTIRFGSLAVVTANPSLTIAKSIRFTIGPVLFPIGAAGEMLMVALAASQGRPKLFVAAALWPFFFYPMMKQLLKQRRKHFHPTETRKEIKAI